MITKRKPEIFIPTLYFAEGLPYTIVMMMAGVFFKTLGADNVFVGLTAFLGLPWILKFAWSPLVDFYATKRRWIIAAEFVLAVLTLGVAAVAWLSQSMQFNQFVIAAVIILSITAIASATQDISIDAYYLDVLNEEQKAFYVGVRNAAYKVAWLFGSGAMVWLAGVIAEKSGTGVGWCTAFAICAVAMLVCSAFHAWYLPQVPGFRLPADETTAVDLAAGAGVINAAASSAPETGDAGAAAVSSNRNFLKAISTYFDQPGIVPIVFYISVFRLGDAFMLKQAPNFLLDPIAKGGLAVSLADMGLISGTVGVIALLVGGIIGSWLLSRGGLKRWMWPLALIQNGAILLYFALAKWPQQIAAAIPIHNLTGNPYLPAVYIVNSLEQFSYGMGVAAYTVFLLSTVKTQYKAAHYATATAVMALGMMVPQSLSGYLTELGYTQFFLISFLASLPGIFAIFFLPIWGKEEPTLAVETGEHSRGVSKAGQVGSESK